MATGSLGASGPPGQVTSGLQNKPRRHNRGAPQLLPNWRNEKAPRLIREAVKLALEQYDQRGKKGDRLHRLLKRKRGPRKSPTFYSVQRKRSDRTEAHLRVLIFQLEHADVAEGFRIGKWDKKAHQVAVGFTLEEYARATGLARPSQRYADNPSRVRSDATLDRVIADLDVADYNHNHQPIDREETPAGVEYSGKVAERKLTRALFLDLGIPPERLDVLVREAKDRRHDKLKQLGRAQPVQPIGALVSEMIEPAIHDLRPALPAGVLEVDLPQLHELQWKVHAEHRDWSSEQVTAEAARRLQRSKPPPDRR